MATAYERLVAEGHLAARVGAGTFVAASARARRRRARGTDAACRAGPGTCEPHRVSGSSPTPTYDFRVGIPDARAVPVRHLAAAARRRAAARVPRPRDVRRPGRPPAAARGDRPAPRPLARGPGRPRRRAGHPRHPAGAGPGRPGARRAGRRGRGRGPRLPVRARPVRLPRRPRRAGAGRRRGPGRRRCCRAAARLVFTTPSHQFPTRPAALAGPAAGTARLRRPARRRDHRGRLRQRVPVHRAAARAAALDSTRTGGCSTSAPSPSRCSPRCASGYLVAPASLRERAARGAPAHRRLRRAGHPGWPWPGSSTTGCSPGTCGRPPRSTPSAAAGCSRSSRRSGSRSPRPRPACT